MDGSEGKLLGDTLRFPTPVCWQVCIKYSFILQRDNLVCNISKYSDILTYTSYICFNLSKLHKKDDLYCLEIPRSYLTYLPLFNAFQMTMMSLSGFSRGFPSPKDSVLHAFFHILTFKMVKECSG